MAGLAGHQSTVQAKRQALRRTRQGALSSCSADGDLPPRQMALCRFRWGKGGGGMPSAGVAPGRATCIWGRCLAGIELLTVCHHVSQPSFP